MKRASILFIIIFILTLVIPLLSLTNIGSPKNQEELVTIFSAEINHEELYRSPFQD